MFVDSALLHSGGSQSRAAGDHAQQAAEHLSRAELPPRIFGDFAAAAAFHVATGSARSQHTRLLLGHRDVLGALGRGAMVAAAGFTDMEENNAASVRAVRCDSAT